MPYIDSEGIDTPVVGKIEKLVWLDMGRPAVGHDQFGARGVLPPVAEIQIAREFTKLARSLNRECSGSDPEAHGTHPIRRPAMRRDA
ncbi:hypothetical protein KYK29_18185 [Shinella daejeonensis]|uniref:hypothetical protein n=1 Tax=Shinella daejeonensis TaxID=659017 RepID=UPI0020C7B16C|nr:hypothetical protein [Shinella daejeonensis]MCP8896859.1 hypothetical protein [Shinella daejeonensis]